MDPAAIMAAAPQERIDGTVLRLVQRQGIHTLGPLVDDLRQLGRLEALIEAGKPPLPAAPPVQPRHPLLATPFRYPPLRHGSRFGGREYRGLFYGSRSRAGVLVEAAYYGLVFWAGMEEPPRRPIRRHQALFSVLIETRRGVRLQTLGDGAFQTLLRHPSDYGPTQRIGHQLRQRGIEVFEFHAARCRDPLVQVGVLAETALRSTPFDQVEITAEISGAGVSFLCHDDCQVHGFAISAFLVEGRLPHPAC
jgi:hypothetical protein